MSEFKHWLDETSEADDFERAILRSGLEANPPAAKQDQIWSGLLSTLALAPLAAATTSAQVAGAQVAGAQVAGAQVAGAQVAGAQVATVGVGKASAVGLAMVKGFLASLAVYGASSGIVEISNRLSAPDALPGTAQQAIRPRARATSAAQPSLASPAPLLAAASDDTPVPASETQRNKASEKTIARESPNPGPALPSVAAFDDAKQPSGARVSQLEAETRALRHARDELRAGRLADAFATLETLQREFSVPELYQEREALMIELLSRSGQRPAAEQRARAFLRRFPESPHAQQIRRVTEQ